MARNAHPAVPSRLRRRIRLAGPIVAAATVALAAGVLPGATSAGAATNQTKSAATARAQSTGRAAVGQGGEASGVAVGRGPAMVTSTFPVLTPQQRQIQKEATNRPDDLGPRHPQGTQAGPLVKPASPSSPALSGANRAAGNGPLASTDFDYFRSQNTTPGNFQSGVDEPSTANDGNAVLYTGNWYGALSTDSGHSFSYINPYTLGPTPGLTNGGFCCDQVAIHAPANGITAWGLLYCPVTSCNSGDNLIRLAVARNKSDLETATFDYYDFSAQSFGFPEGDWLDYPHFGVNADYLMLTMNVFSGGSVEPASWSGSTWRPSCPVAGRKGYTTTRTSPGRPQITARTPGPTGGPRPMRTTVSSGFTTGRPAPTTPTSVGTTSVPPSTTSGKTALRGTGWEQLVRLRRLEGQDWG